MNELCRLLSAPVRRNLPTPAGFLTVWLLLTPWAMQAQQSSADPKPEPLHTTITVVEQVETEAPAYITVLDETEVRQQPGINIDDRLRAIPGFTLFRRTSSIAANPTTQGVFFARLGIERSEPLARVVGWHSAERSVWGLGVLDARRAGRDRPDRAIARRRDIGVRRPRDERSDQLVFSRSGAASPHRRV